MVSVSLRNDNVIDGFNEADLSGNTGWEYVNGEMPTTATDSNGVPLYKLVDGAIVERSEQERAAENTPVVPTVPIEDRVTSIENETEAIAANLDYVAMMANIDIPSESEG